MRKLTSEDLSTRIRLCRQKPPHLPLVRTKRILLTAILDLLADGINHNLRKKLDVELYLGILTPLSLALQHLSKTRTRLAYAHWPDVWRSLLTLLRFLTSYAAELQHTQNLPQLIEKLLGILVFALTQGDTFLADPANYDDLFYKVVEAGDSQLLSKFRDAYQLHTPISRVASPNPLLRATSPRRAASAAPETNSDKKSAKAMETLIAVAEHYHRLLEESKIKNKGSKWLGTEQVREVIRMGYETLEIGVEDMGDEEDKEGGVRWREKEEERGFLKRLARQVGADLGEVLAEGVGGGAVAGGGVGA